ncbi:hypothetical protein [Thermosinus carboxydivorans]|nr:hypothetical protein [Thermosinus carboxydivorans]
MRRCRLLGSGVAGFAAVAAGPLVRSSYHAAAMVAPKQQGGRPHGRPQA